MIRKEKKKIGIGSHGIGIGIYSLLKEELKPDTGFSMLKHFVKELYLYSYFLKKIGTVITGNANMNIKTWKGYVLVIYSCNNWYGSW